LTEDMREQFSCYLDVKLQCDGGWTTDKDYHMFESESSITFEKTLPTTQNTAATRGFINNNNHNLNENTIMDITQIQQLFENADFQKLLKSKFNTYLIEAENAAPIEDVVTKMMTENYLPGIQRYMVESFASKVEKFMVNHYTPTLVKFLSRSGKMFESVDAQPKNFKQFVTMLRESTDDASAAVNTAQDAINDAQNKIETAEDALAKINEADMVDQTALATAQQAANAANTAVNAAQAVVDTLSNAINESADDLIDVPALAAAAQNAANVASNAADAAVAVANAINNPVTPAMNESRMAGKSLRVRKMLEAEAPTIVNAIANAQVAINAAETTAADIVNMANIATTIVDSANTGAGVSSSPAASDPMAAVNAANTGALINTVVNTNAAANFGQQQATNENDDVANGLIATAAGAAANAAVSAANQAQNLANTAANLATQLTEADATEMTNVAANLNAVAQVAQNAANAANAVVNSIATATNKLNEAEDTAANAVIDNADAAVTAANTAINAATEAVNKAQNAVNAITNESTLNKSVSLLESIQQALKVSRTKSAIAPGSTVVSLNENADEQPMYLKMIPESVRPVYEKLNESQKELIGTQASTRKLDTPEAVNRFWQSRDFKAIGTFEGFKKLNENTATADQNFRGSALSAVTRLLRP
jgi:hypothetical protein